MCTVDAEPAFAGRKSECVPGRGAERGTAIPQTGWLGGLEVWAPPETPLHTG